MSPAKAGIIVLLAVLVCWVPALSEFFGLYAAFIVVPVMMILVLLAFGAFIGRLVPAARWSGVALAALVIATSVTLASRPFPKVSIKVLYVIMPPERGPSFTATLANLLQSRGAEISLTQSLPFDNHMRYYTLGATQGLIRVSVANQTITVPSDGRCLPANAWPSPDPGQYYVMVQPRLPCAGQAESSKIFNEIRRDLVSLGYDVRDKQATCAAVANDKPALKQ